MVDFAKMRATAKRLVEQNGRQVFLVIASQAAADVDKPWRGPYSNEETSYEVIGCFVERESTDSEQNIVQRGERHMLLAATSLEALVVNHEPAIAIENVTFVVDGDTRWRVLDHETVGPGEDDIVYTLRLGK